MGILTKKNKYYNLDKTLEAYPNAHYYMLIGERSNGKTFAVLKHCLEEYFNEGKECAIVRRWETDYKGRRGQQMFASLMCDGNGFNWVKEFSNGEWDTIYYYGARWYLARTDEATGKLTKDDFPFCYAFAISQQEHDKSTSYPNVCNVLFDEFLTRSAYLPDEFILFMNTLSTIIRDRNNVKIFMCGNTVNKSSVYYTEMGLSNIKNMKQKDIDVYHYGESNLEVVVEFTDSPQKNKKSNVYFAFNNPKLSMITGKGNVWEMDIYPHCPVKYKPMNILFTYFIIYEGDILQCEIIQKDDLYFTFIHVKTTPIQNMDKDIVYSADYDVRPNIRRRLTRPTDNLDKKILSFYQKNKVFYQDNEVGEIVRNYLMWSGGVDKTK